MSYKIFCRSGDWFPQTHLWKLCLVLPPVAAVPDIRGWAVGSAQS